MGTKTGIAWTDSTWNPIRGCSRVSSGCVNCYAERVAARFSARGLPYEDLASMTPNGPRWTGRVVLVEKHLEDPLRWTKPRRIFTNSMSDLFHENLPFDQVDRIWDVMRAAHWHTFQVLTKRAERMFEYCSKRSVPSNVWLGVSVEDQKAAEERIPWLIKVGAPVKWVSAEPLLGPLDLKPAEIGQWPDMSRWMPNAKEWDDWKYWMHKGNGIGWVVVGGESGTAARPFYTKWAEDIMAQCRKAGVPFFMKQMGASAFAASFKDDVVAAFPEDRMRLKDRAGADPDEWPIHLRVREYPS